MSPDDLAGALDRTAACLALLARPDNGWQRASQLLALASGTLRRLGRIETAANRYMAARDANKNHAAGEAHDEMLARVALTEALKEEEDPG